MMGRNFVVVGITLALFFGLATHVMCKMNVTHINNLINDKAQCQLSIQ